MSEIPFIQALGDALEKATATPVTRGDERSRRPPRFWRPRKRLALALVGLVVAVGGGAAAAALLGSSQRLADGTINCFFTTHGKTISNQTPGAGITANGQSPIAACRRWYGFNAHTGLKAANVDFVACRQTPSTVAVYVSDNRPDQCRRLSEQPLPTSYPAALARLRTLERDLTRLQRRHDCVSPQTLAVQTRTTLTALGFDNWRIVLPPAHPTPQQLNSPAGTGSGRCGSLIEQPTFNSPDSAITVQPNQRWVYISSAPPRHIALRVYEAQGFLYARSYNHCFTAASIRQLVKTTFARSSLSSRFATNATPLGEGFEPHSQKLYEQGCVRFEAAYLADNERYVDISLVARGAPSLPAKQLFPPASEFRP